MAPYEPKTDSREFEVANQSQAPSAWGGGSASDATDIAIRLWRGEWSGHPGTPTWKTDSVFVYMIADLVSASHGRLAEESAALMAAHFDNSSQALTAAKRIQTSMLEFVACRPGDGIGAAILIHQPMVTGSSPGLVEGALGQAKPGQILLPESLSIRLHDLPGIELSSVPALSAGGEGPGLAELVWTTPERIARLQASVVEGAGSRRETTGVGATMIVNSPIKSSERSATGEKVRPVSATGDFVSQKRPDAWVQQTTRERWQAPDLAPRPDDLLENSASSLTDELDELKRRPLITRTRVILGLVAAGLVSALIAVLYFPVRETKVPVRPLENHDTGVDNPKPVTTQPEPPLPAPSQPQPKIPEPPAKLPRVTPAPTSTKPPADTRAKNKKDSPEPPPPLIEESGGLSQNDVPTLLRLAREDAGAGNYDKARSEYRKILQLQPNNQDAKDGLRRLDLIKNDN
jgi:hypothetical protein